jgi:hypothetical protein
MICNAQYLGAAGLETPWAEQGELWAILLDRRGYEEEAEEFRRAKHYQILGGTRKMAYIICRVPPELPVPEDMLRENLSAALADLSPKEKMAMMANVEAYIRRGLSYLEFQRTYESNRRDRCSPDVTGCDEICYDKCTKEFCNKIKRECIDDCGSVDPEEKQACINECNTKFSICLDECMGYCVLECTSKCLSKIDALFAARMANKDRTDPDFFDTGDDILLFVFDGGLRSPLDD